MKIRSGFVSNSSSSSFLMLTRKEDHDEAMAKLTPFERKVIEYLIDNVKAFGLDLVELSIQNGEDFYTLGSFDSEKYRDIMNEYEAKYPGDAKSDARYKYQGLLRGKAYTHREDW